MSQTIKFRQPTEFLGRNGQAKMAGIVVDRTGDDIMLTPVTSRMRIGRAYMLVPTAMAPAVAKAMLKTSGASQKVVVQVRGGVAELTSCPAGVKVEIVDHDNAAAG